MFISKKEKDQLWKALEELNQMVNKINVDMQQAKYGYRFSDGQPRRKPGRPKNQFKGASNV